MRLLITQRRSKDQNGQDIDYLELNYTNYFNSKGFLVNPLPNHTGQVEEAVSQADCLVLSGGKSDSVRDNIEFMVIKEAMAANIPILGICNGLHVINRFFGGGIDKVSNHAGKPHKITITDIAQSEGKVNSYHNYGVTTKNLGPSLKIFATSNDGIIEGFYHPTGKIIAVQWHPERDNNMTNWISEKIVDFLKGNP